MECYQIPALINIGVGICLRKLRFHRTFNFREYYLESARVEIDTRKGPVKFFQGCMKYGPKNACGNGFFHLYGFIYSKDRFLIEFYGVPNVVGEAGGGEPPCRPFPQFLQNVSILWHHGGDPGDGLYLRGCYKLFYFGIDGRIGK